MDKKGLCSTCIHDKGCAFPRRFPVWQCEEFSDYETKRAKTRELKHGKK